MCPPDGYTVRFPPTLGEFVATMICGHIDLPHKVTIV